MDYRILYIFVEGDDDEDFFNAVKEKVWGDKYHTVEIVKYAQKTSDFVKKYVNSINSLNAKAGYKADYIFVADIDRFPCVTARKEDLLNKFRFLNRDRILIVVKEIESWYLAGLCDSNRKKLRIKHSPTTDDLTKEKFNALIPKKFVSRRSFMQALLDTFSLETARLNNRSFAYFLRKFN